MSDPRLDLPDLTAAQLGKVMNLTERQVKDRVAKKIFVCHWRGGTDEHPRGMRFTPEDVEFNRGVSARRPARPIGLSEDQIRKGVARLRRSQGLSHTNAA
jgi:hypothetical protein